MSQPLQRNAADRKQGKYAGRAAVRRDERFLGALRTVLATPSGRLVFGELEHGLLAVAGLHQSLFAPSSHEIAFKAGRHEFGVWMRKRLIEASAELYEQMESEMRVLEARDDRETAAAHTAPAVEEG